MRKVKIAPSILSANLNCLGAEVESALVAGADYVHVDVMDGHFVPNITMGPAVVAALRPLVTEYGSSIDVHLMIDAPERYIRVFADAGADVISIHVESCIDMHSALQSIRSLGLTAGATLNPDTPLSVLHPMLSNLDLVLVMSVEPGLGGQPLLPSSIDRVCKIREMLDSIDSNAELEVDGGVNADNAGALIDAGADILVAGSAVFGKDGSIAENMELIRQSSAGMKKD